MEQGVIMQTIEHQAVARQNGAERCATSITNQQTQIRLLAVQCLLAEHASAGTLDQQASKLSTELIAGKLNTAGQLDPDLVIRASGEQHLSNFMPWQSAFSEFYFSPVCWPEFGLVDFQDAIATHRRRQRHFRT